MQPHFKTHYFHYLSIWPVSILSLEEEIMQVSPWYERKTSGNNDRSEV